MKPPYHRIQHPHGLILGADGIREVGYDKDCTDVDFGLDDGADAVLVVVGGCDGLNLSICQFVTLFDLG